MACWAAALLVSLCGAAEAFGAVFCVALTDQASGKILAFDAAFWNYEPSAMHKDGKMRGASSKK